MTSKRVVRVTSDQKAEIKESFLISSNDGRGLDSKGLKTALGFLGFFFPRAECEKLIQEKAPTSNGLVCYNEYREIAARLIIKRNPLWELKRVFHLIDNDHDGFISAKSLKYAFKDIGEPNHDLKIQSMITSFDKDNDKKN